MGWQKGQSGNPGGRKKGLERQLREAFDALSGGDAAKAFAARLFEIAMAGEHKDSISAIKLALERGWGMPAQRVEVENVGETTIDWSKVPPDERRRLLDALTKIELLAAPEATEH